MNLDAEFVDGHPVLDVAVQTIRLLNQENSACRGLLAQERNHLAKRRAAGALGGLDIFEFLDDVNAFTLRVFVE
ncbi:MAG TPA: hypothetical protein VFV95_02865 [Vicinamibacterales bacterium]|nr:hypothetical protein [Vicinamibacterales bacterium]